MPDLSRGPGRRAVLRLGLAGGAAVGLGGGFAVAGPARFAFGAPSDGDTLVVVSLRGGADGLTLVPPIGDDRYTRLRPNLAVPAAAAHRVDDLFRLHPALRPLFPLWEAGRLGAVHAAGRADTTRSHQAAIDAVELAGGSTGWVDRAIGALGATDDLAATQVGGAALPAALFGPNPAFSVGSPIGGPTALAESTAPLRGWQDALALLPGPTTAPLAAALRGAARIDRLRAPSAAAPSAGAAPAGTTPAAATTAAGGAAVGIGYPPTALGRALRDVARLVRAGVGLRVATVDDEGWDLHAGAGTTDQGPQTDRIAGLAAALLAFATDLGPDLDRVVLVTLSEFGRRVAENGSGGTDHGHGGVMLLLGGGVKGGKVHGRWPGLGPDALADGDLAVTTDHRQVLAEILTRRCGVAGTTDVFPGLTLAPPDVVEPR